MGITRLGPTGYAYPTSTTESQPAMATQQVRPIDSILLSASVPSGSLPIPPADAVGASVLQLTVAVVRNPDQREVNLDLSIQAEPRSSVPVGSIALHAEEKGSTFSLAISDEARKLIASTASNSRLAVALISDPAEGVERRAVAIGAIRWMHEPAG